MPNGFVRIPRRLFSTAWWNKKRAFSESDAVIDLYKSANVRDRTDPDGTKVLRNQFVTSYRALADRWYWPPMKVNRFLKRLEDDGYLRITSSKYKTIITMVDFGTDNDKSGTLSDTLSDTPSDTPNDTLRLPSTKGLSGVGDTPSGTLSDTRSDTYNKKKEKKEYNIPPLFPLEGEGETKPKVRRFTKPTVQEVDDYIKEKGYNFSAGAFVDFYESKGWVVGKSPMKDWKAACRTWQRLGYGKHIPQSSTALIDNSTEKFENESDWKL